MAPPDQARTRPASIHDPITPEQAEYLPAFFWNVRPTLSPQERQREHARTWQRKNYQQVVRPAREAAAAAIAAARANPPAMTDEEARAAKRAYDRDYWLHVTKPKRQVAYSRAKARAV